MIPPGKEPTHANDHWLKVQADRAIATAKDDQKFCKSLSFETLPFLQKLLSSAFAEMAAGDYRMARASCLCIAAFMLRFAAWLHRLELRSASPLRLLFDGSTEETDLPSSPSSETALPGEAQTSSAKELL